MDQANWLFQIKQTQLKIGNQGDFFWIFGGLQRRAKNYCVLFVTCAVTPFMKPVAVLSVDVIIQLLVLLAPSQGWHLAPSEQLHTGDDLRLIWPRGEDVLPDIIPSTNSPPVYKHQTGLVSQACSSTEPQPDKGQSLRERCLRALEQCLW